MKKKIALLLGAPLVAILINSCAGPMGLAEMSPRDSSYAELAKDRPGLATGWGSEKKSELAYTSFTRASSSPAGTDAIFYNDQEGVKAMTQRTVKVGAMQKAAGGLVEWGIKGRVAGGNVADI